MRADVLACIASYEDPDTVRTIATMLEAPGATIRVALCLQSDDQELAKECGRFEQVDMIHVPRDAGRGACWPRALCQSMYEGEQWFFQCDSHMIFEPNWAADLIQQSSLVPEKSVLSSYAQAIGDDTPNHTGVMHVYEWGKDDDPHYGDDGPHCSAGLWNLDDFHGHPLPARFWSAHMCWAPGSYVVDVPYDPQLYFSGEEFSMALRSWTNGYDLYHPAATICRHLYGDRRKVSDRLIHWEEDPEGSHKRDRLSKARVAKLYGWPQPEDVPAGDMGVYGLGTERTREEFEVWAGLDIANRKFIPDDDWRRSLPCREGIPTPTTKYMYTNSTKPTEE